MKSSRCRAVIIGSGLSGLLVSRALSRAKVHHLLLGGPPDSSPRLGESLSLEASVFVFDFLTEFLPYFLSKKLVVGFFGEHVFSCDLEIDKARWPFRLLGYRSPTALFHVDRIGLDAALYRSVVASPYCDQADVRVEDLRYDSGSDTFSEIHLADGTRLRPAYLFDATNHVRLAARAAGVPCHLLSGLQRVVYTHYRSPHSEAPAEREAWQLSTSIVRFYEDLDGLEAIAWCIPLGLYVSIGASMELSANGLTDEEVLQRVEEGFRRRGLVYRELHPRETEIRSLRHCYFVHDRGHGTNWLLVGPSYGQIWWMSGTGVASALAAARIAVQAMRFPEKAGRLYETYMKDLLASHAVLDWFASIERPRVTRQLVSEQSDRLIRANARRLARLTLLGRNPLCCGLARILHRLSATPSFLRGYCRVSTIPLAEQSRSAFAQAALP
ncbi:MAG TPA: hypothetical protein VGG03_01960 [Thermoanaerobaculia bacterium]|jgi:flavin-dependent dehydrogenase